MAGDSRVSIHRIDSGSIPTARAKFRGDMLTTEQLDLAESRLRKIITRDGRGKHNAATLSSRDIKALDGFLSFSNSQWHSNHATLAYLDGLTSLGPDDIQVLREMLQS